MTCRACGGRLATVFVMDPQPLAGAFAPTREDALAMERYPLEWRWCRDCGLVNVWPDIPVDFSDYSYRASDVPALVRHHAEFARFLVSRFPDTSLHIEIGGNDGVLARHLPWPVVNVDPSDAWVGPGVNAPFTSDLVRIHGWQADLITSSNSFAHFSGIGDALDGVRLALRPGGAFLVEVHDLDATLRLGQWDTIYHEHAVEWSTEALFRAGRLHGLALRETWSLPLHGGLIRALFEPAEPRDDRMGAVRLDFARLLQTPYDRALAPILPDGSVAYGAAARATVYLDHVRPNVRAVIDGSPRRQGRFVPGVGLPILPPEAFGEPPAALITARGHEDDIRAAHPGYQGWVTW